MRHSKSNAPSIESLAVCIAELATRVAELEAAKARPSVAEANRKRKTERNEKIRLAVRVEIGRSSLNIRGLAALVEKKIARNPGEFGFIETRLPSERAIRAVIQEMVNEKQFFHRWSDRNALSEGVSVTTQTIERQHNGKS